MKESGTLHWNTPNNGATNMTTFPLFREAGVDLVMALSGILDIMEVGGHQQKKMKRLHGEGIFTPKTQTFTGATSIREMGLPLDV